MSESFGTLFPSRFDILPFPHFSNYPWRFPRKAHTVRQIVRVRHLPPLINKLLIKWDRRRLQARMLRIRNVEHSQLLPTIGVRDSLRGPVPGTKAELLMRKALQLESLVRRPLQAGVGIKLTAPLEEGDDGFQEPGEQNDQRAEGEGETEAEGVEVDVGGSEDLLLRKVRHACPAKHTRAGQTASLPGSCTAGLRPDSLAPETTP